MKFLKSFLPALLIAILPMTSAFAISVSVNSSMITLPTSPIIENGTTLVPMRAIFEAFGMNVNWNDATKTVIAKNDKSEIKLTLGSSTAYINGKAITLLVPAKSINGSTMVPVRFVSEALGNNVEWDPESKEIRISSSSKTVDNTFNPNFNNTFPSLNNNINLLETPNQDMINKTLSELQKFGQ